MKRIVVAVLAALALGESCAALAVVHDDTAGIVIPVKVRSTQRMNRVKRSLLEKRGSGFPTAKLQDWFNGTDLQASL
jgi:hypothetical protein